MKLPNFKKIGIVQPELSTFYCVFLDLEDERPDALFAIEEDAFEYLKKFHEGKHGDVIPIKMTWGEWQDIFSKGYAKTGDK